jgi:hypothetical protein
MRAMKIGVSAIQGNAHPRAAALLYGRSKRREKRFDVPPADAGFNGFSEDSRKRFPVGRIHERMIP